jgi:predicted methyltransferase
MYKNRLQFYKAFLGIFVGLSIAFSAQAQSQNDLNAIIDNPIRTEQDRKLDSKRMPMQMLLFIQAKPGMKVLDIISGSGNTAQLLALAVAPSGKVYAMNIKPNEALTERLSRQTQTNIYPIVSALEELTTEPNGSFDLITIINSYHDMINVKPEIEVVNQRIYDLLKSNGILIVRDHSAKDGTGKSVTKTLHRIDPALVIENFQKVGFKKLAEGDFLKSPLDTKEKHSAQTGDILPEGFIFKFIK